MSNGKTARIKANPHGGRDFVVGDVHRKRSMDSPRLRSFDRRASSRADSLSGFPSPTSPGGPDPGLWRPRYGTFGAETITGVREACLPTSFRHFRLWNVRGGSEPQAGEDRHDRRALDGQGAVELPAGEKVAAFGTGGRARNSSAIASAWTWLRPLPSSLRATASKSTVCVVIVRRRYRRCRRRGARRAPSARRTPLRLARSACPRRGGVPRRPPPCRNGRQRGRGLRAHPPYRRRSPQPGSALCAPLDFVSCPSSRSPHVTTAWVSYSFSAAVHWELPTVRKPAPAVAQGTSRASARLIDIDPLHLMSNTRTRNQLVTGSSMQAHEAGASRPTHRGRGADHGVGCAVRSAALARGVSCPVLLLGKPRHHNLVVFGRWPARVAIDDNPSSARKPRPERLALPMGPHVLACVQPTAAPPVSLSGRALLGRLRLRLGCAFEREQRGDGPLPGGQLFTPCPCACRARPVTRKGYRARLSVRPCHYHRASTVNGRSHPDRRSRACTSHQATAWSPRQDAYGESCIDERCRILRTRDRSAQ